MEITAMTLEAQRIAIAETCGWKLQNVENLSMGEVLAYGRRWWRHAGDKTISTLSNLPDYLNDLNAMHEAEKVLTNKQKQIYEQKLSWIHGDDSHTDSVYYVWGDTIYATAAQRAEAFLCTLDLWK